MHNDQQAELSKAPAAGHPLASGCPSLEQLVTIQKPLGVALAFRLYNAP